MSSLSATQADGYYLPPEYFESGKYRTQSRNQFAGSKGHNQYLQKGVVRFELPYKGVCQGPECPKKSIGRGTRYNAHKVATGESYFSTPIWEFRMACRLCQHPWRIRTNPQARGFDYVEGITIQAGQEDSDLTDLLAAKAGGGGGLDRLESSALGQRKTLTEIERLQKLQNLNNKTTLEDASVNARIRAGFRKDRKAKRLRQNQAAQVGWKDGMELLPASAEDTLLAKETVYGKAHKKEQRSFSKVRKSSIFANGRSSSTSNGRRIYKRPRNNLTDLGGTNGEVSGATVTEKAKKQPQRIQLALFQGVASISKTNSRTETTKRTVVGTITPASNRRGLDPTSTFAASTSSDSMTSSSIAVSNKESSIHALLADYGSDSDSSTK